MKLLILMLALYRPTTGAIHSLRYCETALSKPERFSDFMADGLVDDVQIVHYDSNTMRAAPRQEWVKQVKKDEPDYWEQETRTFIGYQLVQRANLKIVGERFNHSEGHVSQKQYGCEWNEETGEVKGYERYGYDGEDFITFDIQNMTWIPAKDQAVVTKEKWDADTYQNKRRKKYLMETCPQWLKRYLDYGKNLLLREELPSVSLLQKTTTSPVICHATRFYPDRAKLFWKKDGKTLQEGVELGEILPNPDGTYQMMAELKVYDPLEDWGRYQCVFQLQGTQKDLVTKLDRNCILTNRHGNDSGKSKVSVSVICAIVLVMVTLAAIGFILYKRRKVNHFEILEELNPHKEEDVHGEGDI